MSLQETELVAILLREKSRLESLIWTVVRDLDLAEDVFQDVCVAAVGRRESFNDEAHATGWIWHRARHAAIDSLRRRSPSPAYLDGSVLELIAAEWEHESGSRHESMVETLRSCIEALSPYARRVISCRYREGLTGPRLAEALGRKLNTVYVALSRAHQALAECMEGDVSAGEGRR